MSPPELVLASTSPYRRDLLARLRVAFRQVAPGIDEDRARAGITDPVAVARELARRKAVAVHEACPSPSAVVIGSDQVCALGDEIFGKPGDAAGAVAQLGRLSGRSHRLITAVAVAHAAGMIEFHDVTTLQMRALDEDGIRRYVAADAPFDCAGSYRIEALGIALFERIESGDWTAIVGLPLVRTARALESLGFRVP